MKTNKFKFIIFPPKTPKINFEFLTISLLSVSFSIWFSINKIFQIDIEFLKFVFIITVVTLIIDIIITVLFKTSFSPFFQFKMKSLLKTFSFNANLVSGNKSVKWVVSRYEESVFISFETRGIQTANKDLDIPRRLEDYLATADPKEKWILDDVQQPTGFVKMIFTKQEDSRLIIDDLSKIARTPFFQIGITKKYSLSIRTPFTLLTGATGQGKTSTIKALIIQFLATGLTEIQDKGQSSKNIVFTIDFKGSYLYNSMKQFSINQELSRKQILTTAKSSEEALKVVDTLSKIITERYEKMNKNIYEERDITYVEMFPEEPNILLVIDELLSGVAEMQASDKLKSISDRIYPQFFARLLAIINKGRAASVFGIISGQMLPVSILPSEARDSASTRIVLGNISQSQSQEMFKIGLSELPSIDSRNFGGRLFLDAENWTLPRAILAPYFDENKLSFKKSLAQLTSAESYFNAVSEINENTEASTIKLGNEFLNFNASDCF